MPAEVVGAIVGAILSSILTWLLKRRSSRQTEHELATTRDELGAAREELARDEARIEELRGVEGSLADVRAKLRASVIVWSYEQPVLLVGPRAVGKTSLLNQWHTPWDLSPTEASYGHRTATVPFYTRPGLRTTTHWADPTVSCSVTGNFALRVHDFPGEMQGQKSATRQAKKESSVLRKQFGGRIGVVLVCLFDASEAIGLEASADTRNYYNGELFTQLRAMVASTEVAVQRIVIVYNKFDKLQAARPGDDQDMLLERCRNTFGGLSDFLRQSCNPERVCEVRTVLDVSSPRADTRNSSVVFGHAARGIIQTAVSPQTADEVIGPEESGYLSMPPALWWGDDAVDRRNGSEHTWQVSPQR